MYLYRAVDGRGATVEFYLSRTRDVGAAKLFLRKAMTQQTITHRQRFLTNMPARVVKLRTPSSRGQPLQVSLDCIQLSLVVQIRRSRMLPLRALD